MKEAVRADLTDVLAEVRRIDVQARRLVTGAMAGGYLSVFRGSGIEFETVREYADGDPQRAVDWNVTARTGRPFVKTYVDERDLTMLFLLDLSASMRSGLGVMSARQAAARVMACLAFSAVRHGDKVGLVAFTDRIEARVPARKGVRHALRLVRDALALPAPHVGTSPAAALDFASKAVRRHAIVFLISDFIADDWQRPLARCALRHDVVAVRLATGAMQGSVDGLVRVVDPESGREQVLDFGSARVRRAWTERLAAWRAQTDQAFARARVDTIDVPIPSERAPDAIAAPILRFFRMRELRRRGR